MFWSLNEINDVWFRRECTQSGKFYAVVILHRRSGAAIFSHLFRLFSSFCQLCQKKKRDMLPRFCRPLWCKFDFRFIMYSEVSWCWHPHMSVSLTKLTPCQAWRALKRLFIPFCYFLSQYFAKLSAVLQTFVELSCVWSISSMSRVIKLLRDSNIN